MTTPKPDQQLLFLSGPLLHEVRKRGTLRRFRHVRRGTTYVELGRGEVQADTPIREGDYLVIYVGEDGKLWLRPGPEFDDGRFELRSDG